MLLGTLVAAACSGDQLPTFPATGQVVFRDGSPVRMGTVELKSREHGVQARGEIGTDGRFVLTTFDDGDGAVAGMHDCVVVQFVMVEDVANYQPSTEGVVHQRFGSYATSGLECTISEADDNDLIITVEGLDHPANRGGGTDHQHDHSHHDQIPSAPDAK